MKCARWIIGFGLIFGLAMAQTPNLTGTWTLNVAKSSWGKKPKPTNVTVKIDQNEPIFSYSGKVTDANGNESEFHVSCPIDGQQHAVKTSYGNGKMEIVRVNAYTNNSVFRSDDGKYTETATTTVSRDGKQLTRRLHTKSPDGDAAWTEVYNRR